MLAAILFLEVCRLYFCARVRVSQDTVCIDTGYYSRYSSKMKVLLLDTTVCTVQVPLRSKHNEEYNTVSRKSSLLLQYSLFEKGSRRYRIVVSGTVRRTASVSAM